MKIYILADMEGISGIRIPEQVSRGSAEYASACELMMQEINVAIEAAIDAGAAEIVACDTHGGGGQVQVQRMDSRAVYETPNRGQMMPSLDESFAGVILLGHHARAGTLNAFLDHTMSSESWFEYRINNQAVGEIGIEAAYAGHFDVPVIAVTGDGAAAAEAKELLGDVECAVVKWGVGRNRARCLALPEAHRRVREAIDAAVRSAERFTPWKPSLPATVQLTLYRSDMADNLAAQPGIERVDARTVRKRAASLKDVHIW
jgi:D-amino peptidase